MAGRKAKPLALVRLEGTHKRKVKAAEEVKAPEGEPDCPAWLSADAKAEWRRVVPELRAMGLLAKVDMAALAGYCQAWSRWQEAEKILSDEGLTFATKQGFIAQRPETAIAIKYLDKVKSFCSEFGLTPSSRARMSVAPKKPPSKMGSLLKIV